jgi:glycosyltransferase involved in cell wall biosynthesis
MDLSILVIDDSSSDGTAEIVRELQKSITTFCSSPDPQKWAWEQL